MLWQISWRVFIKLLVVCMSRLKISKCCYNCRKFFLKLMAYWSCFSWDFVFSWPLNWYCVFLNYAYIIVPLTSIWKCQWWSKLCLVFPKFMDFNKHSMYIPHFRLDMEIIFYIYASVYSVTTDRIFTVAQHCKPVTTFSGIFLLLSRHEFTWLIFPRIQTMSDIFLMSLKTTCKCEKILHGIVRLLWYQF